MFIAVLCVTGWCIKLMFGTQTDDNKRSLKKSTKKQNLLHNRNPLQDPKIIHNVFSLCTVEELKSVSLVCLLWKQEAQKVLHKTSFCNAIKYSTERKQFLWKQSPFVNYKIDYSNKPLTTGQLPHIWKDCGQWINTIIISKNTQIADFKLAKCIFISGMPVLKTLIFHGSFDYDKVFPKWDERIAEFEKRISPREQLNTLEVGFHVGERFPVYGFLEFYPNLENLRIFCHQNEGKHNDLELHAVSLFREMINKRETNLARFSRIKSLDIIGVNPQPEQECVDFINLMCTWNRNAYPLETLSLDWGTKTHKLVWYHLLQSCHRTLQHLDIYVNSTQVKNQPFTEHLHYLSFGIQLENITVFRTTVNVVSNMEFLIYTPNLKILHIVDIPGILCLSYEENFSNLPVFNLTLWTSAVRMSAGVGSSVKEFFCGYKCNRWDIRDLPYWMPNVTKLTIPVEDATQLETICWKWSHLKEFNILSTGMRFEDLNPILGLKELKHCANVFPKDVESLLRNTTPSVLQPKFWKYPCPN